MKLSEHESHAGEVTIFGYKQRLCTEVEFQLRLEVVPRSSNCGTEPVYMRFSKGENLVYKDEERMVDERGLEQVKDPDEGGVRLRASDPTPGPGQEILSMQVLIC